MRRSDEEEMGGEKRREGDTEDTNEKMIDRDEESGLSFAKVTATF